MTGAKVRVLSDKHLARCLAIAAAERDQRPDPRRYAELRAIRHPWLTIAEAAFELDLTEGRIYQLISDGSLGTRKDPKHRGRTNVRAADVYARLRINRKKRNK